MKKQKKDIIEDIENKEEKINYDIDTNILKI